MKTRLAALALASLALACADNNASIEVYGICSPPDSCTFGGKCDMYALDTPTIDVATSAGTLWLAIEVRNQTVSTATRDTGGVNTSDAFVQEFEIDWKDAALAPQIGRIQQTVPASGSSVVVVWLGPPTVAGRYIANLRLRGIYGDQSHFETAQFAIPVAVCSGCLSSQAACTATCPPDARGQLPISCATATGP